MEEGNYFISVENTSTAFLADPSLKISTIIPSPITITFNGSKGELLGEFKEVDGKLMFDGNLTESGKVFVDFICDSFNQRMEYVYGKMNNGDDLV